MAPEHNDPQIDAARLRRRRFADNVLVLLVWATIIAVSVLTFLILRAI